MNYDETTGTTPGFRIFSTASSNGLDGLGKRGQLEFLAEP